MSRADATAVRQLLRDSHKLCAALGLGDGAIRQAGGLLVRCPSHNENTPSCSVTPGPNGTIRVRCFGCDWSGDALSLIAAVRGLSLLDRVGFREVLAVGAEIGGYPAMAAEFRAGSTPALPEVRPSPEPLPVRDYPAAAEVLALWGTAVPVSRDADSWEWLRSRAIDPESTDRAGVARCLPVGSKTPPWASYRRQSWVDTGHRVLVPMLDSSGGLKSVRACRIEEPRDGAIPDGDGLTPAQVHELQSSREALPKRLPPAGHKSSGLVMANRLAARMLRGLASPLRLVIAEGEPDFLTHATRGADAVLGIVSGSWSDEFARRIPTGTRVFVRTHSDGAGDRYAALIADSLAQRCALWR